MSRQERPIDLSGLALSSCVALVSPWLWFDMRFTRQFPVYYCCVRVVPDKINQCLWIIAGECSRLRSAAERVCSGLFTRAAQRPAHPCDMSCRFTETAPDHWSRTAVMTLCFFSGSGGDLDWSAWVWWSLICGGGSDVPVGGKTLSSPKPNFHRKIEEANALRALRRTLFLFSSCLLIASGF